LPNDPPQPQAGPEPQPEPSVEQNITAALTDNKTSRPHWRSWLLRAEAAKTQAEAAVEEERVRALDPLQSPDPQQGRQAIQDAGFMRDRLTVLLARLRTAINKSAISNITTSGLPSSSNCDDVTRTWWKTSNKHSRSASQGYWTCLREAATIDAEVANITAKPYDLWQTNRDGRELPTVELAARGLTAVAQGCSVMKDMKLPVWSSPIR
jgi:hypothetical protein